MNDALTDESGAHDRVLLMVAAPPQPCSPITCTAYELACTAAPLTRQTLVPLELHPPLPRAERS